RVSVGTVYQRAALATALEACGSTIEPIHDLGKTVVAEAGKHTEPARALELAAALRDEGKRAAEVIRELRRSRHDEPPEDANFSNFEKCPHTRTYTIVRCALCGEELEG
ncbi:MAG TPA: hypothetical protein VNI78_04785, partial [Vicinamibacterales bacterium]|nr:hypothetical protein [Vicinamibacterales bacterium]